MQEACSFITCHRRPAFFHPALRNTVDIFNIFINSGNKHLVDFYYDLLELQTTYGCRFGIDLHILPEKLGLDY